MLIDAEAPEKRALFGNGFSPLSDGRGILLREATTEDVQRLRRMFARCSAETIYRRFHLPFPIVPEALVDLLVGAGRDPRGGRFVVAAHGDRIVGHAMRVDGAPSEGEAEVAVVVEDGWQKKGLGTALLAAVCEDARVRGIEILRCETLSENRAAIRLVSSVFGEIRCSLEGGTCTIRARPRERGGDSAACAPVARAASVAPTEGEVWEPAKTPTAAARA